MAQLAVGVTSTVGSSCATILVTAATMPKVLMSNNQTASRVFMLRTGLCPNICFGMCVGCSLCWRVAKGLRGEVLVSGGALRERFLWLALGGLVAVGMRGVAWWWLVGA